MTPNDPKLSDRGVRRGTCMVGGKVAAEAGAVTHGAVRCSAWLGVRLDSEKTWQRVCEEVALAGDGRTAGTEACSGRCLRSEGSQFTIMKLNWTFRKSLQSTLNLTVIVPSS